jgi:molybdenum cofactor guanylyltransferase
MGRDKASIRLGSKTMLGQIRAVARGTGLKVRVIRKDLVPRCGPLGGVYTALKTTRAIAVLFLACDMPFVSVDLLQVLLKEREKRGFAGSLFVVCDGLPGFPFVVPTAALAVVEGQIVQRAFSIHALASVLKAKRLRVRKRWSAELRNINTAEDLRRMREG